MLVSITCAASSDNMRVLLELDARIERLRDRLIAGDPDLTADELGAGPTGMPIGCRSRSRSSLCS
jgi:hypothetical protein